MTPRLATFSIFAINGAMTGTSVARLPWQQDHLGVLTKHPDQRVPPLVQSADATTQ
jgi:hypothetical protein